MTLVVYADTLVVVTFLYCLSCLLLFGLIYRHPIRPAPLIVGAMAGALLSTYMIVLFVKASVPACAGIFSVPVILVISLSISYRFRKTTELLKATLSLIFLSIVEAGVAVILLSILAYRNRYWIMIYIVCLVFFQGLAIILIVRQSGSISLHRKVINIKVKGTDMEYVKGLADSGNVLKEPGCGRPVIIFTEELRDELSQVLCEGFTLKCVTINGTDYIEGGYINVISLFVGNREREYFHVPVAFCNVSLSDQGFGAIIPIEYAHGLLNNGKIQNKDEQI